MCTSAPIVTNVARYTVPKKYHPACMGYAMQPCSNAGPSSSSSSSSSQHIHPTFHGYITDHRLTDARFVTPTLPPSFFHTHSVHPVSHSLISYAVIIQRTLSHTHSLSHTLIYIHSCPLTNRALDLSRKFVIDLSCALVFGAGQAVKAMVTKHSNLTLTLS